MGPRIAASAWRPLRNRAFALLWSVWLIANVSLWMGDVAAAWLMTSLTDSKLMVALIQTCSTLPVFLLALPSGALADSIDRRHGFLLAQGWTAAVALLLAVLALSGQMRPGWLLALTFLGSMGMALRWPMFSAAVPDVVDPQDLHQAVLLHGVAVNLSRVLGPLLAGIVIAAGGAAWVFVLNAALALVTVGLLLCWRHVSPPRPAPTPGIFASMRQGLAFARRNRLLRTVLLWGWVFFMSATALMGLLPLVAHSFGPGSARIYTQLFSCLGAGAVVVGLVLPLVRRHWSPQTILVAGQCLLAICVAGIALTHDVWLASGLMFLAGSAWLAVGNTLSLTAQIGLPTDMRARGMSLFLMAVMAGGAAGATLFGALADALGLRAALLLLAASGLLLCAGLGRRWRI